MAAVASQLAVGEQSEGRAATLAVNPKFLFELIIADLHWSALQIGSLSLLAAAAAASGSASELHSCRHLVYDDTRVMRLALRYGAEAGLGEEMRRKLDQLYAAIGVALGQMAPFVQPIVLSSSLRDQLPRILPGMRKVAQMAGECLGALEGVTRASLTSDYAEDSLTIRQYLSRAARGELSDADRRGVLATPRLKQRRHSPRAEVNRPCRLVYSGGEAAGELIDVSREGLGLFCKGVQLAQGDQVAILVGGRRMEATVKRVAGQQFGLLLRKPLHMADPLFMGG